MLEYEYVKKHFKAVASTHSIYIRFTWVARYL